MCSGTSHRCSANRVHDFWGKQFLQLKASTSLSSKATNVRKPTYFFFLMVGSRCKNQLTIKIILNALWASYALQNNTAREKITLFQRLHLLPQCINLHNFCSSRCFHAKKVQTLTYKLSTFIKTKNVLRYIARLALTNAHTKNCLSTKLPQE